MMTKIDRLLEFLAVDGEPHPIEEVSTALGIPANICEYIAGFLEKHGFIQNEDGNLRIDSKLRELINTLSNKSIHIPVLSGYSIIYQ